MRCKCDFLEGVDSFMVAKTHNGTSSQTADTLHAVLTISNNLANASTPSDLLEAVSIPMRERGAVSGSVYFIETKDNDVPMWIECRASWAIDHPAIPVGSRFYLPEFRSADAWIRNPHTAVLVSDVDNDPRIDPPTAEVLRTYNTKSIVFLPMRARGHWVAVMVFSWFTPRQFTEQDEQILGVVMQQSAWLMDSVRSQEEIKRRAQQEELAHAESERRARELETVAKVSTNIATILDVDELLQSVVDLTKESFNLYHTHIYLLDETNENLVLAAGAGEPGRIMKERGHKIPLNREHSLVATAARTRRGVISNDVTQEPDFLPNDLLPETRAEMSLPIQIGDQLIGVLDVQSEKIGRFDVDDIRVKTTLADQIAVAVQNARAYQTAERARLETSRLYDTSLDMVGSANFQGYFTRLNPRWEDVTGRTREELMTEPFIKFVHPDDVKKTTEESERSFRMGLKTFSFENRYMRKDGTFRWIQWNAAPDIEQGLVHFIARDVTDNKEREVALREALSRATNLQYALDSSAIIAITDQTGKITYVNDQFCNVSGYTAEELIGQDHRIINSGYHSKEYIRDLWVTIANGQVWHGELRNRAKDGRIYWVDTTIVPFLNEEGKPHQYVAIRYEITERKQREAELALLTQRLDVATRSGGIGVWEYDIVTNALVWDDQMYKLYGVDKSHFSGAYDAWLTGLHPDDRKQSEEDLQAAIRGERDFEPEFRVIHPNGDIRYIKAGATVLRDEAGNALKMIGINYDISERKQREQEIRRRANELEVVSKVSAAASSELDVDKLLQTVADLTKESFNLYHAHVYLLDDSGENLVLAAGAGKPGRTMKETGHRIPLSREHSLVATAARTRKGVVVNDVTQTPDFLPNPMLPNTRAEMSLPIQLGDQLVGVLDVQSEQVGRFDQEDVRIKTALADQIAVAVQNARAYEAAERARKEISRVYETSMDMMGSANFQGYFVDLNPQWEATMGYTLEELKARPFISFVHPDDVERTNREFEEHVKAGHKSFQFVNRYVRKGGEPRYVQWNVSPDLNAGMVYFIARDITHDREREDEILRRANELEVVSKVSAAASTELDVDKLLQTVVDLTKESFKLYHAHIYLLDSTGENLVLAAGAGEAGRSMKAFGHRIPLSREHSLVATAARTRKGVIANDVTMEPDFLPNPMLPETRSEMSLPIQLGEQVMGVLDVQSERIGRFTHEDVRIKTALADQIAVAVENARAYQTVQVARDEIARRANELEVVSKVSAAASTELNIDKLLQTVSDLTKEAFKLYHVHVYLLNEQHSHLVLAAGAGEVGRTMKERGHRIPISREHSLVARAARTRQYAVVNDVTETPDFLPNPLLPDTRSEMSLPLIVGDEVIGVLDVQSERIGRFDKEDVRIKTALANQIAVAVQNARQFGMQLEVANQLRRVDKLRSEFLASMSHELRTPLNSIIGYAEVMLDGVDGELTDEMTEDVQAIHGSGQHLLSLINDILDMAKIDAGRLEIDQEPVELKSVADEIEKVMRVLLKDRPVDLIMDVPANLPTLNADRVRLKQVLNNLISNAVKFTEEGSITISTKVIDDGKLVQISVKDTGVGISEENQKILFQAFRQVDNSSTRKVGGTGLGLAITKHLVEMHGGSIWLNSREGAGSTFAFTMPVVQE
jgi:PAS domain S-box-containing protein